MKHFDETSWADFARNVVTAKTRMAMQKHLDAGCKPCAATLQVWQAVQAITAQESALTPPADVVRVVKSQLPAAASEKSLGFRLLFDSSLAPVPVGIRGSVAARQLLYETHHYYIDLRVEPQGQADSVFLVGQVLHRSGRDRAAQGLTVRLYEDAQPIAEASTNQFGEFQLEFESSGSLSIFVSKNETDEVVLPLYGIQAQVNDRKGLD